MSKKFGNPFAKLKKNNVVEQARAEVEENEKNMNNPAEVPKLSLRIQEKEKNLEPLRFQDF